MKKPESPAQSADTVLASKCRLDWASTKAARFACEHWHYSKALPVGKLVKIGVWEHGIFVGVVLFAWGANKDLGKPYGLAMTQCCELVRVALTKHMTPVSRIVAIAIRMLRKQSPGIEMIVSFADPEEQHYGGIYQAGNWIYTGKTNATFEWVLNGKRLNKRSYTGTVFGKARSKVPTGAIRREVAGKHRYVMPLTPEARQRVEPKRQPYPKRVQSIDSDVAPFQGEEGGANPT